jgi:dCTP deaminase
MKGVLPDHFLRQLLGQFITGVDERFVNPASLDLPLSDEAYRLEAIFLPKRGETVRSHISDASPRFDLRNRLEVGVSYLVRISGSIRLPPEVYGYFNPKSTTGRNNLLCRVVADGVPMYDALTPAGYAGEVWVMLRPESYPVVVSPGQPITQLRLFDGKSFLDELEVSIEQERGGLIFHPNGEQLSLNELTRHSDSLFMSLMVEPGMSAWECRGVSRELDFSEGKYRPSDFFQRLDVRDGYIDLHKGGFYILSTYEHLRLSPGISAELRAIDPRFGEFRSHAAGFIDPGWGWGVNGEASGRPITLEITPHENIRMQNLQTVARIRFERMKSLPEKHYDQANSSYTGQVRGARLSKHFALV